MKVRPKSFYMYSFGSNDGNPLTSILCNPRQRWDAVASSYDGTMVILIRQNVTLYVPKEDFEKYWVTVKEKNKDVQGQLTVYDYPELLPGQEV